LSDRPRRSTPSRTSQCHTGTNNASHVIQLPATFRLEICLLPPSTRAAVALSTPHPSAMPRSKTSKNLRQRRYKPAVYPCRFRPCPKTCANPTGLSQHSASCKFNPANRWRYEPPPPTPATDVEDTPMSDAPMLDINQDNAPLGGFRTPSPPPQHPTSTSITPPSPSQATPRRGVWTTQGCPRVTSRKHKYLSGVS
jgi:hypothetical protein